MSVEMINTSVARVKTSKTDEHVISISTTALNVIRIFEELRPFEELGRVPRSSDICPMRRLGMLIVPNCYDILECQNASK